ncbi:hypothetical protein [Jiella sp. M17.18]|uniref:AraC-like ligand-binding domain-containing protein n=1 Tax=Jiella sp. M17.18 TaxID=3234247 RepID=UPI0034E00F11
MAVVVAGPEQPKDQTPRFHFDTAVLDPSDRFEAYRFLYAGGSDACAIGLHFSAAVSARPLDGMVLFERRLAQVSHERTPARVRGDDFEHVVLQLVLSGEMRVETPGRRFVVAPGEIVVFDMNRPQRTEIQNAHTLTCAVARSLVAEAIATLTDLHGTVMQGSRAGLVADMMVSLNRHAASLSGAEMAAAVGAFAEILRIGLRATGTATPPPPLDRRKLERACAAIERQLADPLLGPSHIAAEAEISRSRLYELFQPFGGVARQI